MLFTAPIIRNRKGDMSKPWYIEFEFDGERFRIKTGKMFDVKIQGRGNRETNKKERQIYFQNLLAAIKTRLSEGWEPNPDTKAEMLVFDALDFALKIKEGKTRHSTFVDYVSRVRKFKKYLTANKLEGLKIRDIDKVIVEGFFSSIQHLAPKTRNNFTITLQTIFEEMANAAVISENPARGRKRHKCISDTHKTYPRALMRKVLSAALQYYPDLFLCMLFEYHCYLRPQFEVGALRWSDLDMSVKTVTIRPANSKIEQFRTIPLHSEIVDVLQAREHKSEFVFPGKEDGHINKDYFGTQFRRLRKIVEIPKGFTLYGFKHTGACDLYKATKDIYLVSKMLGHTSVKTTEIYLRSLGQNITFLSDNSLPNISDDL